MPLHASECRASFTFRRRARTRVRQAGGSGREVRRNETGPTARTSHNGQIRRANGRTMFSSETNVPPATTRNESNGTSGSRFQQEQQLGRMSRQQPNGNSEGNPSVVRVRSVRCAVCGGQVITVVRLKVCCVALWAALQCGAGCSVVGVPWCAVWVCGVWCGKW